MYITPSLIKKSYSTIEIEIFKKILNAVNSDSDVTAICLIRKLIALRQILYQQLKLFKNVNSKLAKMRLF